MFLPVGCPLDTLEVAPWSSPCKNAPRPTDPLPNAALAAVGTLVAVGTAGEGAGASPDDAGFFFRKKNVLITIHTLIIYNDFTQNS